MINGYSRVSAPRRNQYSDPRWLTQQQAGMQETFGAQGKTATENYLARALAFDPTEAINTYARGAWAAAQPGIRDSIASVAGAGAAGRINTGFFDLDKGDVINRATENLNANIAQTAVTGAEMAMRNNAEIGRFGTEQQNRFTDLLMSRRQEIENAAREEAERKRRKRGFFGNLIGQGLGMIAGSALPGIGTAIGRRVGGAIANRFGGR